MNAYELADELANYYKDISDEFDGFGYIQESATMLRQQADRIAELEKVIQDGIKTMGEIQDKKAKEKFLNGQDMIYKTFEEWKAGQWLEDGESRTKAYTKDELLLVEMGWKYGFDAGKAQQADQLDKVIPQLVKANGLIENLRIRIAELEKSHIELEKGILKKLNQEMMSRPVAIPYAWHCRWFDEDGDESWEQYEKSHPATRHWDDFPDKIIPLYTHPHSADSVKVKQLSDEEIVLMYYHPDFRYEDGMLNYMKFARAIIKEITE